MFVEICLFGDYNDDDDDDDDKVEKGVADRLHLNPDACPARWCCYFDDDNDKDDIIVNDDDDDNEDVGDRLHLNPDACPARRRAQLAAVALAIRVGGELVEHVLIGFVF